MSYTASASIRRIKSKGFISTAGSLTDPEVLEFLDDALRSVIVPFLKGVRDEWFVSGTEDVTPDANGRIAMPNSVASTIRSISWMSNGSPVPLTRIEPENAYAYQGSNGGGQPYGYMLKAYEIQILPTNIGSVSVRIDFMERPAEMVLEEDAAEVTADGAGSSVTVAEVPLAWQSSQPASVDVISGESPFSVLFADAFVDNIAGTTVTFTSIDASDIPSGSWLSDPGTNPFPNVPIEFHPLLQRSVITEIFAGTGDKRLADSMKLQTKLEKDLRATMAPRTQGSARPIVNKSAPGMGRSRGIW